MHITPRSRLAAALAPAALLFVAGTANAATCEEAFVKKGNPITGLRFTGAVTVADLPPAVAIGQMRGIVAAKGYDIMADEAEYGSMLIEQPMTGDRFLDHASDLNRHDQLEKAVARETR